jgi:hypothetical protein
LGSGYYGTRHITLKNFKESAISPAPYNLGTISSGLISAVYSNGPLQKATITGNVTLTAPNDGSEGKHMEFVFTTTVTDVFLDFDVSYGRSFNVFNTFPVTLKANSITVVQTYRTATNWIITYVGVDSNVFSHTFAELKTIADNNNLVVGRLYKVNDFELKWNDSTTAPLGLGTVVRSSGVIEPLIMTATAPNKLSNEAYSELHPSDVIYYDINATYSVGWGSDVTPIPNFKGWIYRRYDVFNNIDIGWDWRYIKNTCYKYNYSGISDWNSGTTYQKCQPNIAIADSTNLVKHNGKVYYSLTGTGNVNRNPSTQSAYWASAGPFTEVDTYYACSVNTQTVIVGLAGSFTVPILTNDSILQPTFVNTLTSVSAPNITGVKNVKIVSGYNNVIVGISFESNGFGNNFHSNTISTGTGSNACHSNIVGNAFYQNAIGNGFLANDILTGFNQNFIGNSFWSNKIEHNFFGNYTGFNTFYNSFGSTCNNNTLGSSFSGNTINVDFDRNTIGRTCTANTMLATFRNNTIGESFSGNYVANGFENNTVDTNFRKNNVTPNVSSVNFTGATYVYGDYPCSVSSDTGGGKWVAYYGTSGNLITAPATS